MPKPKPVEILLNEAETDTLRSAPARSVLFERQCRMFRLWGVFLCRSASHENH
jgi:hypothetical protein